MPVTPYTVVTVEHFAADGTRIAKHEDLRNGGFEVGEQVTSYMREVAVSFWKELKERKA